MTNKRILLFNLIRHIGDNNLDNDISIIKELIYKLFPNFQHEEKQKRSFVTTSLSARVSDEFNSAFNNRHSLSENKNNAIKYYESIKRVEDINEFFISHKNGVHGSHRSRTLLRRLHAPGLRAHQQRLLPRWFEDYREQPANHFRSVPTRYRALHPNSANFQVSRPQREVLQIDKAKYVSQCLICVIAITDNKNNYVFSFLSCKTTFL